MKNIYVLPTDKPSRFFITNEDEYGFREHYAPDTMQTIKCMNIHITSEEEIKVGDWFIHPDSSCFDKECKEVSIGGYEILQVIKVDKNFIYHSAMMAIHKNKNIKKIILTTDQDLIEGGVQAIDDEFLEWFVKNPTCEYAPIITTIVNNKSDYKTNIGFELWRKEEPKDVVLGYKTSIVAQMLDSKEELKQKSPVEWLESRITVLIPDDIGSQLMFKNNIKKAKEMEENQQKLLSASWAKSREQTREVSTHIGFASGFMNGLECYEDYYSELDKTELDEDEFTRNYIVDIFEQTYKESK
jgi:hypothetical protein